MESESVLVCVRSPFEITLESVRPARGQAAPYERLCFTHSGSLARMATNSRRHEFPASTAPLGLVLERHRKPVDQIVGTLFVAGIPSGVTGDKRADHPRSMPESAGESVRLRTYCNPRHKCICRRPYRQLAPFALG